MDDDAYGNLVFLCDRGQSCVVLEVDPHALTAPTRDRPLNGAHFSRFHGCRTLSDFLYATKFKLLSTRCQLVDFVLRKIIVNLLATS